MRIRLSVRLTRGRVPDQAARRRRLQAVTEEFTRRVAARSLDDTPRDTSYMAEHQRATPSDDRLKFALGWWAQDFVGQTNPATEKRIEFFYPDVVVRGGLQKDGTRRAGHDPLTPAIEAERAWARRAYLAALVGG